ncbi:hypothetical protein [Bowmanella sp. JS7-9]|uniref:Phage tail protein n=1 Tax=Pseudobowmanella zhangzhouensis TaxID=1537679 RepID=A0ABW1XLP0_9ALTE|nr:hypothetical protein [Bowmanella sp. JS7-9]TBX21932.1 hypothetical protein TK45_10615 [Bowmanella sp. JS7-9]
MKIVIHPIKGMLPIIESAKLPLENATLAINCRFDSGSLEPYADLVAKAATLATNTSSIYLYGDTHWFSWSDDVDLVESPINNDQYSRAYFTGSGSYPKITAAAIATGGGVMPTASYKMGVQQPTAPILKGYLNNTDDADAENDITRFYVQTYVNAYGEESMPSDISEEITLLNPDASVELYFDAIGVNDQNITKRRLYRTNGDAYQLVAELDVGLHTSSATAFEDNVADAGLGIVLESWGYSEPNSAMKGLTAMANGILAGFWGNTVAFSEQYQPHAWPTDYQQTTEFDVVAIKGIGNSIVVGTTGNPYLFAGVSPDAVSGQKLEIAQSCVSKRSMVDMGNYVIYASPDGLVGIGPGMARLLTEGMFNKKAWANYNPETIVATYYEDKYVAFFDGGGFIFDPRTQDFIELDFSADAVYTDLKRDTLYIVQSDNLFAMDEALASMPFTWEKVVRLDYRPMPSCVYIDCERPQDLSFSLWLDGALVADYADLSAAPDDVVLDHPCFRLPQGRGKELRLQLAGTGQVHRLMFASNLRELMNG